MTDRHIALFTAILLSLTELAFAQGPALFYNLEPGQDYFIEADLQQSTHSESIDSEEISFYNLVRMEFHVDSVDSEKQYHMRVRYRDLLISMLAPQMEIDISSASGKDRMLTDMVQMLEQGSFSVLMTDQGQILSIRGLDELFAPLTRLQVADTTEQQVILSTLAEAYGPDAFRSLCNVFLWIYPVIQPMNNWTNDVTYFFNTKAVKLVNRYILGRSDRDEVVIQGMGMLNSTEAFYETTGMGDVKSAVSGSQTYDFQMDPGSGWLKRCVSRQRVIIETTILKSDYLPRGLKIPSYTETTFEIRGGTIAQIKETERK